jgi:hypothetical protein
MPIKEKKLPQIHYNITVRKYKEYISNSELPINVTDRLSWYKPEVNDSDTYFAMINSNRRVLQPGEQAYYCYGSRSNKFLL